MLAWERQEGRLRTWRSPSGILTWPVSAAAAAAAAL